MKIKVLALIVSVALFAGGIGWIVGITNSCPYAYSYSGDIVFDTEDEYAGFKEFVISDDVKINDMAVLSSEPPIWVRYDVTFDTDRIFPYEYENEKRYRDTTGLPFGYRYGLTSMVAVAFFGMLLSVFWLLAKEEDNRGIKAENGK